MWYIFFLLNSQEKNPFGVHLSGVAKPTAIAWGCIPLRPTPSRECLLISPKKELVRKWCRSWATLFTFSLEGLWITPETKETVPLLAWLSAGSSGLVNGACVGSIGVNLLFLFLLVQAESSGNGNQPEICTLKGIVCPSCSGPSPPVISILPFSNFNTPTSLWLLL